DPVFQVASCVQGRSKPTRKSLGRHKSEDRNPRSAYSGVAATRLYAERSPKSEGQTGSRAVLRFGLRHRDNQPSRLTFRRKSVRQAEVTERSIRFVKSDLRPQGIGDGGIVLSGGQLQGFLSGGHGVWESPDLGVSRRQYGDNCRILAAGKLLRLLGQLDRRGAVSD